MSGDISATSSRKIVPLLAISNAPGFSFVDPVNAPFSWPNSSFSRISLGSAAQLRAKNGPFARSLFECTARATSSLPVPDSPRINIEAGVDAYIAAHGKIIPGFGHRWHGVDPRAVRLLALVREAEQAGVVRGRFARIAEGIERQLTAQKDGRPIPMNIDGATAVIYSELGFAPELGRGIFILSRSVGILAHAWEQTQQGGRIKGPMSPEIPYRYTGPAPRTLDPKAKP